MAVKSGYSVTLTAWIPANPEDHESVTRASKAADALKRLDFKTLAGMENSGVEMVEVKARFVSRRDDARSQKA